MYYINIVLTMPPFSSVCAGHDMCSSNKKAAPTLTFKQIKTKGLPGMFILPKEWFPEVYQKILLFARGDMVGEELKIVSTNSYLMVPNCQGTFKLHFEL